MPIWHLKSNNLTQLSHIHTVHQLTYTKVFTASALTLHWVTESYFNTEVLSNLSLKMNQIFQHMVKLQSWHVIQLSMLENVRFGLLFFSSSDEVTLHFIEMSQLCTETLQVEAPFILYNAEQPMCFIVESCSGDRFGFVPVWIYYTQTTERLVMELIACV